jgi:hypothetical protein
VAERKPEIWKLGNEPERRTVLKLCWEALYRSEEFQRHVAIIKTKYNGIQR